MHEKIFILLSLFYLLLGCVSIFETKFKDDALKVFFILTVLLPIAKFTTSFHTINQVSIYYFFFIGPFILFIIRSFSKNKISKPVFQAIFTLLVLFVFYVLHYFLLVNEEREVVEILKDIKPFVLIALAFIFIDTYKTRLSNVLTRRFCNTLLLVNLGVMTVFFYFMVKNNIHLALTEDPYYKYEELRLETFGVYFGLFYLLSLIFNGVKISIKEFLLVFIPLLYTGNRTIIFASFTVVVLFFLSRASVKKIILFFSSATVLLSGLLYLIFTSEEGSPLTRFKLLFSYEYIEYALVNRFSPFIEVVSTFNPIEFMVGKGFGLTFFIPWFEFREGIKNHNIYIDNLYLTLYAKYGLLLIVFYYLIFLYLKSYRRLRPAILIFCFVLIITITNAFVYQTNFLWIFLLMALPFKIHRKIS